MEPIAAINGMDVVRLLERSSGGNAALESLGREFAGMLAQPPAQHPVTDLGAKSAVGELISQHDHLYSSFMHDVKAAPAELMGKSPQEATMKGMELMLRAGELHMQHTGYSAMAQNVKNGLQTLMKNQ